MVSSRCGCDCVPDYNAMAKRADKTLAKFGAPAVLERALKGDYDPTVGAPDDAGTQVYNTTALRGAYRVSEIDGTKIKAGDVRLYVSPLLAVEPRPGDVIAFDGAEYVVVNSNPVKPATVVVCHDVQARGV
jgi:hypothetical protein